MAVVVEHALNRVALGAGRDRTVLRTFFAVDERVTLVGGEGCEPSLEAVRLISRRHRPKCDPRLRSASRDHALKCLEASFTQTRR